MSSGQLDKETYRQIIKDYFNAFGTGDFSQVRFSPSIQFLSPISGITMNGRHDVQTFVEGVSTRVTKVNVLSITVDFPTASGVWQMTTTKGTVYTLHNFFRLDGDGLVYIWPMFDPKAVIADPPALLQWLRGEGYYEVVAQTPKQPTGVTVTKSGRIFACFPRWIDYPWPSVGEIGKDGSVTAYPNEAMNAWDEQPGDSASTHFVCVHTLYTDSEDNLWILDPGSPGQKAVVADGAKLLKVNLTTNQVVRTYSFDSAIAPLKSYLNKMRFANGYAFITDSNLGAIVVLNLTTGSARRLLEGHTSTRSEADTTLVIDAVSYTFNPVHVDGIALDPSGRFIYYKALTGSTLYRIPVAALIDESLTPEELGDLVEKVAETEPTGGIEFDRYGNLYMTAVEEDAIKVLRPDGRFAFFARATNFTWPDTITVGGGGYLIFTASQLHLLPAHNGGVDKRKPPYNIFRLKLDAELPASNDDHASSMKEEAQ
jgi:sugar lactone lactonase YvrE